MPKSWSTRIFILILFVVAILLGYNYFAKPFAYLNEQAMEEADYAEKAALGDDQPETNSATTISSDEISANLSPRAKIAQLMAVPLEASSDAAVSTEWVEQNNPGLLVVYGSELRKSSTTELLASFKSLPKAHGARLLPAMVVDHEGGKVQRLNGIGYTKLPSWSELCNLSDDERLEYLDQSSRELADTGINIVLAPVVDLAGPNAILGDRVCDDDWEKVASASAEFIKTFSSRNIISVLKHFPDIGSVTQDLHKSYARVAVSDESSELYRALLKQYPRTGVMISHAGVTNGGFADSPCSLNPDCVGALHGYFPTILTFTDSLNMQSAFYSPVGEKKTLPLVSEEALAAGNTILLYDIGSTDDSLSEVLDYLENKYNADPGFAGVVDERVNLIIEYKNQLGLLNI